MYTIGPFVVGADLLGLKKLCWSIMGHVGATTHGVQDPLLVCGSSSIYSCAIIRQN